MSVKISNLKKSEFDPRVRGSVFFQISLKLKKRKNFRTKSELGLTPSPSDQIQTFLNFRL